MCSCSRCISFRKLLELLLVGNWAHPFGPQGLMQDSRTRLWLENQDKALGLATYVEYTRTAQQSHRVRYKKQTADSKHVAGNGEIHPKTSWRSQQAELQAWQLGKTPHPDLANKFATFRKIMTCQTSNPICHPSSRYGYVVKHGHLTASCGQNQGVVGDQWALKDLVKIREILSDQWALQDCCHWFPLGLLGHTSKLG